MPLVMVMETFVRLFTAWVRRARAFGGGRRLFATKTSAMVVTIASNTQLIFLCFIIELAGNVTAA